VPGNGISTDLKEDLNMSTNRTATLTIDGKTVEFPVMVGTHGQDVIDIRTLGAKTGYLPMTPASCRRQVASRRSPSSTATRANCSIAAIR
jgi:hypothetical protein